MSTVTTTTTTTTTTTIKAQEQVSSQPSWTLFDIYVFENLSILNFQGVTKPEHRGTLVGSMESLLDRYFPQVDWRAKYCTCDRGSFRDGLRRMLNELLGIRSWLEFAFGASYQQYRSIDAYVSMWHFGMAPPPTEVWLPVYFFYFNVL